MTRRSSSLNTSVAIARQIGTQYEFVKVVADNLDSVLYLASIDLEQLANQMTEATDFEGISVVAGDEAGWNPDTKTITVPTLQGEKGDKGLDLTIIDIMYLGEGRFRISFSDGTTYETPSLQGKKGDKGDKGDTGESVVFTGIKATPDYRFIWSFSDGTVYTTPPLRGQEGRKGDTGKKGDTGADLTIENIENNQDGTMTVWFSDGTVHKTQDLRGSRGRDGARGQKGETGTSVHHLKPTSTTNPQGKFGVLGELDTYTFYGDVEELINLGHFRVHNGVSTQEEADLIGIMARKMYDGNNNGIVDNSEKFDGLTPAEWEDRIKELIHDQGTIFVTPTVETFNTLVEDGLLSTGDMVLIQEVDKLGWQLLIVEDVEPDLELVEVSNQRHVELIDYTTELDTVAVTFPTAINELVGIIGSLEDLTEVATSTTVVGAVNAVYDHFTTLIGNVADLSTNSKEIVGAINELYDSSTELEERVTQAEEDIVELDDTKYDKTGGLISGDVTITGDLYIKGETTQVDTEHLLVKDNLIHVNSGEEGQGITQGFAGMLVDRGQEDDFLFGFDEGLGAFALGKEGDLQPAATREPTPLDEGVAVWDGNTKRFVAKKDIKANAESATKLETARKIGGVEFDGTEDILPRLVKTVNNKDGDITGIVEDTRRIVAGKGVAVSGTGELIDDVTVTVKIGKNLEFDEQDGIAANLAEAFQITKDGNGFPNRIDSVLTFNHATSTVSVAPRVAGNSFTYFYEGQSIEVSEPINYTLKEGEKDKEFYLSLTPTKELVNGGTQPNLEGKILCAHVLYSSVDNRFIISGDERHSSARDTTWHTSKHIEEGMVIRQLGSLQYVIGGTDIAFSGATVADEDLIHTIIHSDNPTRPFEQKIEVDAEIPLIYFDADRKLREQVGLVSWNTAKLVYQAATGLEPVPDGLYVNYFLLLTQSQENPVKLIAGRELYDDLAHAHNEVIEDLGLALPEVAMAYRIVLLSDENAGNVGQCSIQFVSVASRSSYRPDPTGGIVTSHDELFDRNKGIQHIAEAIGTTDGRTVQEVVDSKLDKDDESVTNAREWVAEVVSEEEAKAGTANIARKWTAQRVRQAILAWWASSPEKTKLDGIATGATKNDTDAVLKARANHTGTQAISTVSGLQAALDAKLASNHASVTNAREWTAATIPQAEAEEGTATTRRAFTAQRLRQGIVAWFNGISGALGRTILSRTTAAQVRSDIGLGTAATRNVGAGRDDVLTPAILGVGGFITIPPGTDINTFTFATTDASNRAYISDNSLKNMPINGSWWSLTQSGFQGWLTATSLGGYYRSFRRCITVGGKLVGDWYEIHHTGNLLQTTGTSTDFPMSQKAVTDALNTKASSSLHIPGNNLNNATAPGFYHWRTGVTNAPTDFGSMVVTAWDGTGDETSEQLVMKNGAMWIRGKNNERYAWSPWRVVLTTSSTSDSTTRGGLKSRLNGTTLYMRSDGSNA